MKLFLRILLGLGIATALFFIFLPNIIHLFGFHPDADPVAAAEVKKYDLAGKKVLILATSHSVLNKPGETDGPATGVFASEMTIPYYEFLDAGMTVDIASIRGGEIPIDPQSFYYFLKSDQDRRFIDDPSFQAKVKNALPVDEIDFKNYDVVFFAGGWGAAYDMASDTVGKKISDAYYNSDVLFGSVCHGALAFTTARDRSGEYLVKGRTMTGVTQKQLEQFGITYTPKHPEQELIKCGADYRANHKIVDPFATITVIDAEKRFITGQNQNSSHATSLLIMKTLAEKR